MTLVLTLASEREVHMTCDFKLTDANTGAAMSLEAHKLVTMTRFSFQAIIGITGWARLGGMPIGDWIAQAAGGVPSDAGLDSLFDALREAEKELAKIPRRFVKYRHLTFVVGAMQGTQAVVAMISNCQNLQGWFIPKDAEPAASLRVSVARPHNPRFFVAGAVTAVRSEERKLLERSLRSGVPQEVIRQRLATLNAKASKRTNTVSEGCYAASLLATGRGATQPFLVEQHGEFIPPGDITELMKKLGIRLRPAKLPGGGTAKIQSRGETSVIMGGDRRWYQEQFKIRPNDSELWNNFGALEGSEGNIDAAREAYVRALELNPDNYFAARNLGTLLWFHYGDGEAGRRWLAKALEVPDTNHQRETLSWLAKAELECDKDVRAAEQHFERSMVGDPISSVEARYANFLLHFRPEKSSLALETYARVVTREPNYSDAVTGLAVAQWLLLSNLAGAQSILMDFLERFPKDAPALWHAVHFSIAADNLDEANKLFTRLRRTHALSPSGNLSVEVMIALCKGGNLYEADAALTNDVSDFNRIVSAAIKTSLRDLSGALELLNGIAAESLPASLRVIHATLACVALEMSPSHMRSELDRRLPNRAYKMVDDSLLRALGRHSGVEEGMQTRLRDAATVARER